MSRMISGKDLADKLGISEQELAALRQELLENEHWMLKVGKVSYTEAGVEEIVRRMGVMVEDLEKMARAQEACQGPEGARDEPRQGQGAETASAPPSAAEEPKKKAALVTDLTVLRVYPNPIWVDCRKLDGTRWRCRVTNNRRLRAGQILAGCKEEGDHWFYPRMITP